jgi:hypothetical protein
LQVPVEVAQLKEVEVVLVDIEQPLDTLYQ